MSTRLEHFPNELLLDLFTYFDIRNLHASFWGINQRFNNLLRSLNNLSLIIRKDNLFLIKLFARQITRLNVNNSKTIDLRLFPNLHLLQLSQPTNTQLEQIRSNIMPNLICLLLSTSSYISLPHELVQEIFSNAFQFLRRVHLGRLYSFQISSNSQSSSLYSLHVTSTDPNIISHILLVCPNLHRFHVTFFDQTYDVLPPSSSSSYDHVLNEFVVYDPYYHLSFDTINSFFQYIPNVKYLLLQFLCSVPFIRLIESILTRLEQLERFECDILELPNNEMIDIETIQQLNECFECIQCIERDDNSRVLSTEN